MEVVQIDLDEIWLKLCNGNKLAQDRCKTFLESYVQNSER